MVLARLSREFEGTAVSGTVIGGNHSDYEKLRKVWNGLWDRRPAAIVRARNETDVASVVRVAAEHGTLLAIRCGGHSLPGLSICDDGIVLDLSQMCRVVVDPVARVAEVGGGALLGHLDAAGSAAGLATPAGVVSHTGVAGLTLGGGMGWLSRRFGLTIDNLSSAEVVTADGRLVSASPDSEPELFWGIRGGGGNFGVVTKFRFRMYPLGPVLVGRWDYPPEAFAAVLRGYRDLAAHAPRELTTAFTMTATNLSLTAFWSGSAEGSEAVVRAFGISTAALSVPSEGRLLRSAPATSRQSSG
ncbi:FAD-binding oxidoreductase [Mesorhizobium sp.]|uniref:FAD-binding oxidoreductase n=1 Tax=Mesorhizobium sp. TaxID=1871066 RepID=UPI0011F47F46|nr:FAD-dependent oxidoreductase [Mesorhizobium sp.]TIS49130.1 MAG: FAD-dependent oxidoreductase [Mesorhizobium sp.]